MIPPQILTSTGRYFDFTAPECGAIEIEDIATALSRICRFTGHTTEFYSVAQHSVYVSFLVPDHLALAALLHDASEAYLGDVSSPLKRLLPDYKRIEERVERAICDRFGVEYPLDPAIKEADLRMLVTERRDLMPKPRPEVDGVDRVAWSDFRGIKTVTERVRGVNPDIARLMFLGRYKELTY
jgi:hypothetical protein